MAGLTDEEVGLSPKALSDEDVGLAPQNAPQERAWKDVPLEAVKNIPSSAVQFGHDIAQPFLHPVETGKALYNVARGAAQKLGSIPSDDSVQYADAVGQLIKDRYGSMGALKKTLATDPVGFASDLSLALTGGATAAAKVPAAAGAMSAAARAVDPIAVAGKAATGAGKVAATAVGELGTYTGRKSLETAARAGFEGGEKAQAFREGMRGTAPMGEAVEDARKAIANMRQEQSAVYKSDMASHIATDPTVLDFGKIDKTLQNIAGVQTYSGRSGAGPTRVLNPETAAVREKITNVVNDWRAFDPTEFHTVEGFDALKKELGGILSDTKKGTPEWNVANRAYNAVRGTIIDQAPQYGKIMKGYESGKRLIREIEDLAGKPGGNIEAPLRKLQAVLRNNVSSAYGRRAELAEYLVNAGAPNLMEKLAGQAMNSWVPRGMGRLAASLGTEMAMMAAGAVGSGLSGGATLMASLAPFMSPRLMGEAAYYLGRGAGATAPALGSAGRSGFQPGRVKSELEQRVPFARGGSVTPGSQEDNEDLITSIRRTPTPEIDANTPYQPETDFERRWGPEMPSKPIVPGRQEYHQGPPTDRRSYKRQVRK